MQAISSETIDRYPFLAGAGLSHRRGSAGEEKLLVDNFLKKNLTPAPDGQISLVFIEPRLATGFPDVVVVYLDAKTAKKWKLERASFTKREICVLHHLAMSREQELDDLRRIFPHGLGRTLKKLLAAELVQCNKTIWRARATGKLMAVRRIVAIEAKVGAWRPGLDQAFMNRWFASESYLLLPAKPRSQELDLELRASGVGLLTADTPLSRPLLRAHKSQLPGSYASWLFNEWACHAKAIKPSAKHDASSPHDLPQVH